MDQKINRNLLPNIKYAGTLYSLQEDGVSPLAKVLKEIEGTENTTTSLFLTATGGMGKSTTLRALWLDFLMGKFEMPCVYVDLKLLSGDGINAIKNYLEKEYKLSIDMNGVKPILLLDGINEANYSLRVAKGNNDCALVKECKELMGKGFRLVLSSRSKNISEVKESIEQDIDRRGEHKDEFDSNNMLYGELCELTDEQVSLVCGEEKGSALFNLLKNNFMLSIYKELSQGDKEEFKQKSTAGQLLDVYFTRCFKIRYILNSDEELRKEFSEEDLSKIINEGQLSGDDYYDEKFGWRQDQYNKYFDYLMKNANEIVFKRQEFKNLGVIEHLSILQKNVEGDYVWANEIYQEYFEACRLSKSILKYLKDFKDIDLKRLNKILNSECYWGDDNRYYVLKYAGEISGLGKEGFDILYKKLFEFDIRLSPCLNGGECINHLMFGKSYATFAVRMSVLCDFGIPESASFLDSETFYQCSLLKELELPDSITDIDGKILCIKTNRVKGRGLGGGAFYGCKELKRISGKGVVFISDGLMHGTFEECTSLESFNFPNLRVIGCNAFSGCVALKEIKLPKIFKKIEMPAFDGCSSIERITVEQGNKRYISRGNCLIEPDTKTLVLGCMNSVLPNDKSVSTIGMYAFSGCDKIKEIYLSEYIAEIREGAFNMCGGLEKISVNENNAVFHSKGNCLIETGAKYLVRGCNNSVIPNDGSVTSIGWRAFSGCSRLTEINIPDSVGFIYDEPFYECKSLNYLKLPKSLNEVNIQGLLFGCDSIKKILISKLTKIKYDYCTSLEEIEEINKMIVRY